MFFVIIGIWYVHGSDDDFLMAVLNGIFAGGFGAIIPARITSIFHKKHEDKKIQELTDRSLPDMNYDAVHRYVTDFDDYQSELMEYENYKAKK